jgi:hypothetical protein
MKYILQDKSNKSVFISYAREDEEAATRLYNDLRRAGAIPWRDREAIRPGQDWKYVLSKAIKNNRYFIPLLSSKSVTKIGYVNHELSYALEVSKNFPQGAIYIIPVRLDNCDIPENLANLHCADLFPDWTEGLKQILSSLDLEIKPEPVTEDPKEEQWRKGLSESDWKELLKFICKKKCIPFVGPQIYAAKNEDEKNALIPLTKNIINKWKRDHEYPLADLYELARIYALEDSYQLARLAEFLEIENADEHELYPKTMLSDMIKGIDLSSFPPESRLPYEILAGLDLPIYITTNYDRFLEEALFRNKTRPESDFLKWSEKLKNYVITANIPSVFDDDQYKPTEERPLVYHIHGDINIPESMVLTERDYFEFVINANKFDSQRREERTIFPPVVRSEIATSSLLFIGYTLEDINFRAIFQGFLSFLSQLDRRHRKLSIAIQIPPESLKKGQAKMQKYLEQYTRDMFDVHIFWGTTIEFLVELDEHWKDFKEKNDMKTCTPLGGT